MGLMNDLDDAKYDAAPPPAYSDYGSDDEPRHSKNMSVVIEAGKVKNVAAKLAIDPSAMLPGSKAPKPSQKEQSAVDNNSNLSRPAPPSSNRKSVEKKKKS